MRIIQPQQLTKYTGLDETLGRGSFGIVRLAFLNRKKPVAIKKLKSSSRDDILFEAKVLQLMGSLGFAPRCLGVCGDCIVMDCVCSLRTVTSVSKGKRSTELSLFCRTMTEAIGMPATYGDRLILLSAYHIVEAVEFMHSVGLCHNDIKADNILIEYSGRSPCTAVLIDYGKTTFMDNPQALSTYYVIDSVS